jgi:hypothetical protein
MSSIPIGKTPFVFPKFGKVMGKVLAQYYYCSTSITILTITNTTIVKRQRLRHMLPQTHMFSMLLNLSGDRVLV